MKIFKIILFIALIFFTFTSIYNFLGRPIYTVEKTNQTNDLSYFKDDSKDRVLLLTAYYGGAARYTLNMPKPPSGKKVINGYVEYHGKPAIGVRLKLMLNDKYFTNYAVTNELGIASWNLANESWYLNLIEVNGWDNKPQNGAKYIPITGMENKLGPKYSSGSTNITEKGKELLGSMVMDVDFKLEINEEIKITWPYMNPIADSSSVVNWDSVYGADKYLVMFWHAEGRYFDLEVEKVVFGTSLSLSDLKYEAINGEKIDYNIEVRGFSEDGYIRSQSTQNSGSGPKFILSGQKLRKNVFDSGCSQ